MLLSLCLSLGHSTPQSFVIICAVYSFVFWFENGFLQIKSSKYYCLRNICVIFLLCQFLFANTSKVELEILRNSSTIFRSSHQVSSIKKAFLKHFVIVAGKYLCKSLFFNKVAGLQVGKFI